MVGTEGFAPSTHELEARYDFCFTTRLNSIFYHASIYTAFQHCEGAFLDADIGFAPILLLSERRLLLLQQSAVFGIHTGNRAPTKSLGNFCAICYTIRIKFTENRAFLIFEFGSIPEGCCPLPASMVS